MIYKEQKNGLNLNMDMELLDESYFDILDRLVTHFIFVIFNLLMF